MGVLKYSYLPITYHLIPRVKGDTFRSILFRTNINITNCDIFFTIYHKGEVLMKISSELQQIERIDLVNGTFRVVQFLNTLPLGIHHYDLTIVDNELHTTTTYLKGTITIIE